MKNANKLRVSLIGVGGALLGAGLGLFGRSLRHQNGRSLPNLADQAFIDQAALDGLQEISLGHLAVQRGQHQEVRELGQRLISDFSRASSELISLALRRGLVPPGFLPRRRRAEVETLARISGSVFDTCFAKQLISTQRQVLSRFQNELDQGADPELRAFAKRTLPLLHENLRLTLSIG